MDTKGHFATLLRNQQEGIPLRHAAWRRGFMKLRGSYFSMPVAPLYFFCFDWVLARARATAKRLESPQASYPIYPIYPHGRRVTSWRPRITSSTFGAPLTTTRWISPMRSGSEAFLTIRGCQAVSGLFFAAQSPRTAWRESPKNYEKLWKTYLVLKPRQFAHVLLLPAHPLRIPSEHGLRICLWTLPSEPGWPLTPNMPLFWCSSRPTHIQQHFLLLGPRRIYHV